MTLSPFPDDDTSPDENNDELTPDEIADLPEEVADIVKALVGARAAFDEARKQHHEELFGDEEFEEGQLSFGGDLAAYDQAAYTRSQADLSGYRYNLSESAYSYSGGWMSSWYSGYNTVDRAIEGVHNHVATFATNADYGTLEIVPDLDDPSVEVIANESASKDRYYGNGDIDWSLVARIDSSLYEKLGINEAQQHYIVDGIAQVLSAQSFPDPSLVSYLQSAGHIAEVVIPNVIREIITEITRASGLPLLLDQMPGWLKRVTAFRAVMFVGEPPNNDIPSAFLMYAVWERETVETIEHQDAIEAIEAIEGILAAASPRDPKSGKTAGVIHKERVTAVQAIQEILVNYVTGFGPSGRIVSELNKMKETIHKQAVEPGKLLESPYLEEVVKGCEEIVPYIHEHNRTFCPDPSKPTVVQHQDFPDCPNKELLPEPKRERVELTRKCLFHLVRIPGDVVTPGSDDDPALFPAKGIKRINDMLGLIKTGSELLKAIEKGIAEAKPGNNAIKVGRSGVNSTRHPELKHRSPVRNSGTDREFGIQDPEFDRTITIYDSTIAS